MGYDKKLNNVDISSNKLYANNLEQIIHHSDIIFGCTGTDITQELNFDNFFTNDKIFISCSSEDKEFLSLIKWIQNKSPKQKNQIPLDDIVYPVNERCTVSIVRGGFPINFDTAGEVEPAEDIQLTRGLLLGGILQAIVCSETQPDANFLRYMLHPDIQQYVVSHWIKHRSRPLTNDTLNQFCKQKWIEKNSGGTYFYSKIISKIFHCKTNEVKKDQSTWDMMMHKKVSVPHSF